MRMKRIWILTMFPDFFRPLIEFGVLGATLRGERGDGTYGFELNAVRIPDYSFKDFKGVDDAPFGGGAGMVMRADVLENALLEGIVAQGMYDVDQLKEQLHIVCPLPRGKVWNHAHAVDFAARVLSFECDKDVVFIAGRYEGIDERFLEKYVDEFISVGDYILTGGEIAVMSILDSAMRFVPGVLGNKLSAVYESFSEGMLEHPLYTRPREFHGALVPEAYLSGDPKKIKAYNDKEALCLTQKYRPDLMKNKS